VRWRGSLAGDAVAFLGRRAARWRGEGGAPAARIPEEHMFTDIVSQHTQREF
jgi:hypothetical protein